MDKYSFCNEIKEKYHINDLESKTLTYRIDGLIDACNMNYDNCVFSKEINIKNVPYSNLYTINANGDGYNANYAYQIDPDKGKYCSFSGHYNELHFLLINYFDMDKNKNKINDIPFTLILNKMIDEYGYILRIGTKLDTMTSFKIIKFKAGEELSSSVVFLSNIRGFGDILSLVNSFVSNPEMVYDTYLQVMNQKNVVFSNDELKKAIINEEKIENSKIKTRKR